jgi:predicted branched-subunit amino acid permease
MRPETIRLLNLLQLLSEIAIAVGYLIGLIPFVYLWSCAWVIPLVFVNLVFAILTRNGTTTKTVINIVMAFLSFIPVAGYLFRVIGIVISWINIQALAKGRSRGY